MPKNKKIQLRRSATPVTVAHKIGRWNVCQSIAQILYRSDLTNEALERTARNLYENQNRPGKEIKITS